MAQAQTIEPTNFDEINFQITSKENPDAYIESRFVPGNPTALIYHSSGMTKNPDNLLQLSHFSVFQFR